MGEKRGMKALELWCKRVTDGYPGVKVENMTTSWRDGLAFCALIHHFRPDLIDFSNLKKNNIYGNNELAFRTAERHLGIPALLDAEDMVEYEVPDRLSILTYLSQFYQTFASHPSSPIKRSVDSTDCPLVLSPSVSTPPPKEVRRREPCFTCGLPVFLAQRLIVGGHLYHRTCFRCARCSAQLTLANCYETQDGAYCCETCPDEEMVPKDIGDKGGGPATELPTPLYIETEPSPKLAELSAAADKTDSLVTSRTASLVGLRRMMFENIAHTDDEKSPRSRKPPVPGECDKLSGVIDEQPNKVSLSDKKPLEFNRKSSDRLSNSRIVQSDCSFVEQDVSVEHSDSVITSDSNIVQSDVDSSTHSSGDNSRPKLEVSQYSLKENSCKTTEVDSNDKFSNLNIQNVVVVETTNIDIESAHSKLDLDSDLEPNSCSSDASIVQAKNDIINNSDDEIEYNKLIESKESLENKLTDAENDLVAEAKKDVLVEVKNNVIVEAKNDAILESSEQEENQSCNAEADVLLSHVDSKALKRAQEEDQKSEDEFTSLTHNIEQLVVNAKNEDVIRTRTISEKEGSIQEVTSDKSDVTICDSKVPAPTIRVKHKPPTPHTRRAQKKSTEPAKKSVVDYPEDLNPFGDDVEEEEVKVKPSVSTNPFGSSDEDEDISSSSIKQPAEVPKPAARRVIPAPKVSLNPFWSGDEEEEEDESLKPIPKPRKLHTPQPSPEPSPQPRRLRPATGTMGSATSLASRKKKPAPLPPNWQSPGTPGSQKSPASRPPPVPRMVTPSPPPLPLSSPPSSRPPSPLDSSLAISHKRTNSIVSETSSVGTIGSYTPHKSMYGQWKRKKGPAPPRPVPVRRAVQPMPLASVRQELSDIEIKQQGLERQGVKLEQTIREKFEQDGASLTPYVEELVLQLFELVNEKNELFRRQAELMYLRRQHNLEEEHAELEYQIRCLMLCPERNKTDSDKTKEEQLIQRLVEVVERRNEIIDCLEMDRLREKEEDRSVGTQLGIFSAAVGSEVDLRVKHDKKGKKSKKEKRWSRKDMDKEVEEMGEKKKNKKKWFTLHHSASKS